MRHITINPVRAVMANGMIRYEHGACHFDTSKDCGSIIAKNILRGMIDKKIAQAAQRKEFFARRAAAPFGRGVDISKAIKKAVK